MTRRICNKCGIEKSLSDFRKRSIERNEYRKECKSCSSLMEKECKNKNIERYKERKRIYYKRNKEKILNYIKEYRLKNIKKIRESDKIRSKKKRDSTPKKIIIKRVLTEEEIKQKNEKIKEVRHLFFEKNKDALLLKKQEYRKNNSEKYKAETKRYYEKTKIIQRIKRKKWINENRETYNQYFRTMKKNNPLYKLSCTVRGRINNFLKRNNIKKKYKSFDIVGCSPQFLKEHLENQFTEGMNWGNHGQFGWHIDHRIPLDSAKTEDELYKLCHYTNLQPLWWLDNIHKSAKIV